MKTYEVKIINKHEYTVSVEAESEEKAVELVDNVFTDLDELGITLLELNKVIEFEVEE